jgi:very-short-patch-repair endonuclease
MPKLQPTRHTLMLAEELEKRGVHLKLEHWDGHKHIDIFIPEAKISLEIDGLRHYTNPTQIIADFHRDYFSNKADIFVKHIPNDLIETHVIQIAEAITKVVGLKVAV